jgi:hypothetical protein
VALRDELGIVISVELAGPDDPPNVPRREIEWDRGNLSMRWAGDVEWVPYRDARSPVRVPAAFSARFDVEPYPNAVELVVSMVSGRPVLDSLALHREKVIRHSVYTEGMEAIGAPLSWTRWIAPHPITASVLRKIAPRDLLDMAVSAAADWPGWEEREVKRRGIELLDDIERRLREPLVAPARGPYSVTDEHLRRVAEVYLTAGRNPIRRVQARVQTADGREPSRTTARRWVKAAREQPWWPEVARQTRAHEPRSKDQ